MKRRQPNMYDGIMNRICNEICKYCLDGKCSISICPFDKINNICENICKFDSTIGCTKKDCPLGYSLKGDNNE
jgi:hypothetical protein